MFLMHPSSSENFKVFETGIEYFGAMINVLRDENPSPQN
jgi:hypothetical protein